MTIQQLHYAIVISETGSLNKASEKLYVSQPSLSSSMQELEREMGFQIFSRSGRGMTLTSEGQEYILYARQVWMQYQELMEHFGKAENRRKKFGVSSQHYSFAVKAFVALVGEFDTSGYDFAIRETKTREVISDVSDQRSELGILYLSDFNRSAIGKLLRTANLTFHPLICCRPYVYLWSHHPLAAKKSIRFEELKAYPCLCFEQGDSASFYYAEEILSTREYERVIHANDRATMLNLMVGLNGYTLCSGIISRDLNGSEFVAIPFEPTAPEEDMQMEIGYLTKKNIVLSEIGTRYVEKLKEVLREESDGEGREQAGEDAGITGL